MREEWKQGYQSANPAIACEILCLSESVRWHKLKQKVARLAVIPDDFYEAYQEQLLRRDNHLCFVYLKKGKGVTPQPSTSSEVSPPKDQKLSDSHKLHGVKPVRLVAFP